MGKRTITLNNRCKIDSSKSANLYATRSRTSTVFTLPHSQILSRKKSELYSYSGDPEDAIEYDITDWLFNKIKLNLEVMEKRHCSIKD